MTKKVYHFFNASTSVYFNASFSYINQLVNSKRAIYIIDENVFNYHKSKFIVSEIILIKPGEAKKSLSEINRIIKHLIKLQADRNTLLIGVGGGVVTDIVGYVSSIYMRGIECGFVPTTLLAMVDASVGGKNGINMGVYKNIVGSVKQPSFLLYDISFLDSLSKKEWQNGFAEIIKHAAIKDASMFKFLQHHSVTYFQKSKKDLTDLIRRNVRLKIKLVQSDEFEKGDRKLLNFGHTIGHAIENQYGLSHGQSISVGMKFAALFSCKINGFSQSNELIALLHKYGLITDFEFKKQHIIKAIQLDKKRKAVNIDYVLLNKLGKGLVHSISLTELEIFINSLIDSK